MITFHCRCGRQLQVPAAMAGKRARCPSCQNVSQVPEEEVPVAELCPADGDTDYAESAGLKVLYLVALVSGLGAAAYIYLFAFNRLSETVLVQLTPYWFFPVVFGLYGFVSQTLIRYIREGKAATLTEAAKVLVAGTGYWALIGMFPFLLLKWRNSFLVTLAASLWWAILLWIFFAAIFPAL